MPQSRKRNTKDPADRRILNPRGGAQPKQKAGRARQPAPGREVGQYTGEGNPPIQKK